MDQHITGPPDFRHTFQGMEVGVIIGILDHQGAVESYFIPLDEMGDWMHGDIFDFKGVFHRWRWHYKDGISTVADGFKYSEKMDVEDNDRVLRHLTRKYGLEFGDRGWIDYEHFMNKVNEEIENGIEDPYD